MLLKKSKMQLMENERFHIEKIQTFHQRLSIAFIRQVIILPASALLICWLVYSLPVGLVAFFSVTLFLAPIAIYSIWIQSRCYLIEAFVSDGFLRIAYYDKWKLKRIQIACTSLTIKYGITRFEGPIIMFIEKGKYILAQKIDYNWEKKYAHEFFAFLNENKNQLDGAKIDFKLMDESD